MSEINKVPLYHVYTYHVTQIIGYTAYRQITSVTSTNVAHSHFRDSFYKAEARRMILLKQSIKVIAIKGENCDYENISYPSALLDHLKGHSTYVQHWSLVKMYVPTYRQGFR